MSATVVVVSSGDPPRKATEPSESVKRTQVTPPQPGRMGTFLVGGIKTGCQNEGLFLYIVFFSQTRLSHPRTDSQRTLPQLPSSSPRWPRGGQDGFATY